MQHVELKGFSPKYGNSAKTLLSLASQLPAFVFHLFSEHFKLKKIIHCTGARIVISDNRYGLTNRHTTNVLITHQLMVKTPSNWRFTEPLFHRILKFMISRFDHCWIPDYDEEPTLSGDLAHKYKLPANALFVNPLSRLSATISLPIENQTQLEVLAIISGPEPQRSIFETILRKQLAELPQQSTLICGKPESDKAPELSGNITILQNASSDEIGKLMRKADIVICRSGYSTLMDICATGGKALFVPTPGQTEQEYLASRLLQLNKALYRKQDELNLITDIPKALTFKGFSASVGNVALAAAVNQLHMKQSEPI